MYSRQRHVTNDAWRRPAWRALALVLPILTLGLLSSTQTAPLAADKPPRTWQRITEPNPTIQEAVDGVEWDGLHDKILMLQNFGTRLSCGPTRYAVAESLAAFFEGLGLDVTLQEYWQGENFFCPGVVSGYNVIATQPGILEPDSFFIISGHHDSMSGWPTVSAPGADDNASGVAGVMTAAEQLRHHQFAYTIKYICFGGEEYGGFGSAYYVKKQAYGPIAGALNLDMIGYWEEGLDWDLEVETNEQSIWLANAVVNAAALYTDMPCDTHISEIGVSDNISFWTFNFPALNLTEGQYVSYEEHDPDFNPRWHTSQDCIQYLYPDFTVACTRVAVAALATVAQLIETVPVLIRGFDAAVLETRVELVWSIAADDQIIGFNIYRGTPGGGLEARINADRLIPPDARKYDDTTIRNGSSYWYVLGVVAPDGTEIRSQRVEVTTRALALALAQNYPNPFNPSTTIAYTLAEPGTVTLRVFDVEGRVVTTLVDGPGTPGMHTATWDGLDQYGAAAASGVYFVRLESGGRVRTAKIALLK